MTNSLYVWEAFNEEDGWYTIGAIVPGATEFGTLPLVVRKREMADGFAPIAFGHADSSGEPVRLARYDFAELEDVDA